MDAFFERLGSISGGSVDQVKVRVPGHSVRASIDGPRPAHHLHACQLSSCKSFHETTIFSAVVETPLQHWRFDILPAWCIPFVFGVATARGLFDSNLHDCEVLQKPAYALGCLRVRYPSSPLWCRSTTDKILCRLVMGHMFITYVDLFQLL